MKPSHLFYLVLLSLLISCTDNSTTESNPPLSFATLEGSWAMNLASTNPNIMVLQGAINRVVSDCEWCSIDFITEDMVESTIILKPSPWNSGNEKYFTKSYTVIDDKHITFFFDGKLITLLYALSTDGNTLTLDHGSGKYEVYNRSKPLDLKSIAFWINAFIPKDIPGLTFGAPVPWTSKTALNVPTLYGGGCTLTDQRDYSDDVNAPVRVQSFATFNFENFPVITSTTSARIDESTEIDCNTGLKTCSDRAISISPYTPPILHRKGYILSFDFSVDVDYPCGLFIDPNPNINYTGSINIDLATKTFNFNGDVDVFPAYEAYVSINGNTPIRLLAEKGTHPWFLFGAASIHKEITYNF